MCFEISLPIKKKKSSIHILFRMGDGALKSNFHQYYSQSTSEFLSCHTDSISLAAIAFFLCLSSSYLHLLRTVCNPTLTTGAAQERQCYKDNSCYFRIIQVENVDKGCGDRSHRNSDPLINIYAIYTSPFFFIQLQVKTEWDMRHKWGPKVWDHTENQRCKTWK